MGDALKHCIKLLCLGDLFLNVNSLRREQYLTSLSFVYLNSKEKIYLSQAEQHAEEARKNVISRVSTPNSHTVSEQKKPDSVCEMTLTLIILLTNYILGRVKATMGKEKEALKYIQNAQVILDDLLDLEAKANIDNQQPTLSAVDQCENNPNEEGELYDRVECLLMKPGYGFYPRLKELQTRLLCLNGKCRKALSQYGQALNQYQLAMTLLDDEFAEEVDKIPILYAMANLFETRKDNTDTKAAIDLYQKIHRITSSLYNQEPTMEKGLKLMLSVHRLSQARMRDNSSNALEESENMLKDVLSNIDETHNAVTNANLDEGPPNARGMSEKNLLSLSRQFLQTTFDIQSKTPGESNLRKQFWDISCSLRSTLARIYLDSDRSEDAVKLFKTNLAIERAHHGLYGTKPVRTQKMLLNIAMSLGNMKESIILANECLSFEDITFGPKSQPSKRTRDIIKTLVGNSNNQP